MKDLKPLIQAYINNWDYINEKEIYKWEAIKFFQKSFKKEGTLSERTINSLSKHDNLLDSFRYYPYGMLYTVAKAKPNRTNSLLKNLFDEKKDLKVRITSFMSEFENIIKEMIDEGYGNWKGQKKIQSYQNVHAISVYLSMRYPKHYYIYQSKIFNDFSNIIGYKIQHGDKVDKYIEFNQLCGEVKKELLMEEEFIAHYNEWMKQHRYKDESYNLLTQDFIYAVAKHLNSEAYAKADKNEPITANEPMVIPSSKFPTLESKTSNVFKGKKNVDYDKKDKLYRNIGKSGEYWAIIHEKERLSKLGISFEVRHSSVHDGDGIGYDILSVENDGVTPRYIEVKTTTGGVTQPFFYTDNELQFSEQNHKHYYVYRVYNFKTETEPADLLIICGSLKYLNGRPVSYKASMKK